MKKSITFLTLMLLPLTSNFMMAATPDYPYEPNYPIPHIIKPYPFPYPMPPIEPHDPILKPRVPVTLPDTNETAPTLK